MKGHTGFCSAFANESDGLAAAHFGTRLHKDLTQVSIESGNLLAVIYLDGKAKTAKTHHIVDVSCTRGVDRIASDGHIIDARMRKRLFRERVVNHLEAVLDGMVILKGMNDGRGCRQCGISFDFCKKTAEGGLYFGKTLAGRIGGGSTIRALFQHKTETAKTDGTVSKELSLFCLEDGFVNRPTDFLNLILDDVILAINGKDVSIGYMVRYLGGREDDEADYCNSNQNDCNNRPAEGNFIALYAGGLPWEDVYLKLLHYLTDFPSSELPNLQSSSELPQYHQ